MLKSTDITNQEKISIVKTLFRGRKDAHGEGEGICKKEPITDQIILRHLTGKKRIGIYPLSPDIVDGNSCYFACVDIDTQDLNFAKDICFDLQHIGIPSYIEASRAKGYHVWTFFEDAVDAKIARGILQYAIGDRDTEIFPKQTTIGNGSYGNYINLPLFGSEVLQGKTAFLDSSTKYQPAENQWKFLQKIKKIGLDELTEICDDNFITMSEPSAAHETATDSSPEQKDEPTLKDEYDACEFFSHCRENAATLAEPLWYAMLSNLSRFENGEELAHQFSQEYPDYNEKETNKKFNHAKKASGPITCQTIAKRGFECPSLKRCKANAPAGLFVKITTETQKTNWTNANLPPHDDEKDLTASASIDLPSLPQECWRGGFYDYREALKQSTEACDEYHFSLYLAAAGLIIGRHSALYYGRKLYPNFYICNVGNTGESRKSSAAGFIIKMLEEVDDEMLILRHLATPEGLLKAMQNEMVDENEIPTGRRTLAFHNELASLIKKANHSSSSGLIERLTSLYDCPSVAENPTLVSPIQVARPFLTMIGLSTGAWLEDSLTERDIMGGFANRFLYFTGKTKAPIAFPEQPNEEYWEKAKMSLLDLRESTYSDGVIVTLDDQAHELWKHYYENEWKPRKYENETITALIQRIPDDVMKTAIVYARLERQEKIDWKILDAAIKVGEFSTDAIKSIFRLYGVNEYAITEAKVIDALKKLGGEASRSKLYKAVTGRISAHILQKNYESLANVGRVKLWTNTYHDKLGRPRSKAMVTLLS